MNNVTMTSITISTIIGIGLSFVFAVDYFNDGPVTHIDSKILKFYGDFMLQSNTDVYSVKLVDDFPSILLIVSKTSDGYVVMDDPTPLFQELYPNENVTTLVVLAGGNEIPHKMENNRLQFNTSNEEILLIGGE